MATEEQNASMLNEQPAPIGPSLIQRGLRGIGTGLKDGIIGGLMGLAGGAVLGFGVKELAENLIKPTGVESELGKIISESGHAVLGNEETYKAAQEAGEAALRNGGSAVAAEQGYWISKLAEKAPLEVAKTLGIAGAAAGAAGGTFAGLIDTQRATAQTEQKTM